MPKFIDIFMKELEQKGSEMKSKLEKGRISILDDDYKKKFKQYWLELPDGEITDKKIIAVDGSRALREFVNNYKLYIVRALGINNFQQESFRYLETNVVNLIGPDINKFMSIKTEFAEFALILNILESINKEVFPNLVILLDGSIYGRMLHVLQDTYIEEERGLLLKYMETYSKILQICEKEKVLLIGVSKDSSASFFRNQLLDYMKEEELKELQQSLSSETIATLRNCVDLIDNDPIRAFENFYKLTKFFSKKLIKFEEFLKDYHSRRTDNELIMRWKESTGYSRPMELGPARHGPKIHINRIKTNLMRFIKKQFRRSLLYFDKPAPFIKYAKEILEKYLKFPTIISFHLLLDFNDSPMRIDIPSWVIGSENSIESYQKTQMIEEDEILLPVKGIIKILKGCYAGLNNYNIFLKKADDNVKLHNRDVDKIYEKLFQKELKILLHHTRDYRRVSKR